MSEDITGWKAKPMPCFIDVQNGGTVHIAYEDPNDNNKIYYVKRSPIAFASYYVGQGSLGGIALPQTYNFDKTNGFPYFLYTSFEDNWVCRWNGNAVVTVASYFNKSEEMLGIVANGSGANVIPYIFVKDGNILRCKTLSGTTFTEIKTFDAGENGSSGEIKLDANLRPHVAYVTSASASYITSTIHYQYLNANGVWVGPDPFQNAQTKRIFFAIDSVGNSYFTALGAPAVNSLGNTKDIFFYRKLLADYAGWYPVSVAKDPTHLDWGISENQYFMQSLNTAAKPNNLNTSTFPIEVFDRGIFGGRPAVLLSTDTLSGPIYKQLP